MHIVIPRVLSLSVNGDIACSLLLLFTLVVCLFIRITETYNACLQDLREVLQIICMFLLVLIIIFNFIKLRDASLICVPKGSSLPPGISVSRLSK